jgi:DNA-binding NarL/FixJ family response regulator
MDPTSLTKQPAPLDEHPKVVLVADSWTTHAEALAAVIRNVQGSHIAWTAENGTSALALADSPDIVSIYVANNLADMPLLQLLRSLRTINPHCRLVVGLDKVDAATTQAAVDAGATAVIGPRAPLGIVVGYLTGRAAPITANHAPIDSETSAKPSSRRRKLMLRRLSSNQNST